MDFKIIFSDYFLDSHDTGIEKVDEIRQGLGLPNLPIDIISEKWGGGSVGGPMEITEELARKSGHFLTENRIRAFVSKSILEQASTLDVDARKGDDGTVYRATLRYRLNKDEFLRQWEAAGFPRYWKESSQDDDE